MDKDTVVKQIFKDKTAKDEEYSLEKLSEQIQDTDTINENIISDGIELQIFYDTKTSKLKGEEWKQFKNNEKILVSNFGRVKIHKDFYKAEKNDFDKDGFCIAEQEDVAHMAGYLQLKDWKSNFQSELWNIITEDFIYQLVAEVWLEKDEDGQSNYAGKWDVHHISNNGYDNRPKNLIYLKRGAHCMVHNLYYKNRSKKGANNAGS